MIKNSLSENIKVIFLDHKKISENIVIQQEVLIQIRGFNKNDLIRLIEIFSKIPQLNKIKISFLIPKSHIEG